MMKAETISRIATGDFTHKEQIGGSGEFAKIILRLEPLERGAGLLFASEATDVPNPDWIAAAEEGIREAAKTGLLQGFPVVDVKVTLLDVVWHEVDTRSEHVAMAAAVAFGQVMAKASPKVIHLLQIVKDD